MNRFFHPDADNGSNLNGAVDYDKTYYNQELLSGKGNFGTALNALEHGKMVSRSGWNGKGMFIYKTVGNTVGQDFIPKFASLPQSVKDFLQKKGQDVVFNASFTMYTAAGEMQPGWLASQADMLATDWGIIE